MFDIAIEVMAGVGLFLLGMALMTEGLTAIAGDSIKSALRRFTRSPVTGVLTGAISAGILQSSSATIIATVGFVGAGLLSFSQALGIVLGASVGTTFTGWLVVIVGFKLQFGTLASILILVGALLRLFGGPGRHGLAYSLAGFGLIFVGIAFMQEGMSSLQGLVDFTGLGGTGPLAILRLALLGVAFTIVTQSSSAGVIAALAAFSSGLITLHQAASLVIGMNVGTTFTSAVATIGGDVNVRRTGWSHVLFNLLIGTGAAFYMGPYLAFWEGLFPEALAAHGEIALVGFHTSFNLIGVLLVMPFIHQYARLMERLFPEPVYDYQRILDPSLLKHPELALSAVQKVLLEQLQTLSRQVLYMLGETSRALPLTDVARQLDHAQRYVDAIHLDANGSAEWERLLAAIHMIDHLQRLHDRCQNSSVLLVLHDTGELRRPREVLLRLAEAFATQQDPGAETLQAQAAQLAADETDLREVISRRVARGDIDMKQGVNLMEAARWLQRVAMHFTRIHVSMRRLNYQKAQG